MHCTKKISEDITWVGTNDRRLALFENVYPIERGTSYNSYLVKDEKTVLIDTVDKNVSMQFFENLEYALDGRKLDYIIVNHMEPDHSATLQELVFRHPEVTVVCNKKTVVMIKQFFNFDIDSRVQLVVEGDTLNTGKHTFSFVLAPMVHWPEVMVTYDVTDKILFSADAFGTFGTLDGNIFADEVDFERDWLDDARRYYTNIVGKYGPQVQNLLKKASNIDIKMICPLHGPVWRKNLNWFIDKYQKWSTYTPEIDSVLILSGSIYGHTENAAEALASRLYDLGIKGVKIYDVSKTHPSYIVAEAFKFSHIVIAAATYNAGIFTPMETVLLDLKAHNLKNRTVGLIYNGSWVPVTEKVFTNIFETMSGIKMLEHSVKIMSTLKPHQEDEIEAMAQEIRASIPQTKQETNAMFKINYGLYLLSAKDENKDNACIINAVNQITDNPKRIAIAVNKQNLTHEMVLNTGNFSISVLTEETPFSIFSKFGYHSGKDVEKFADINDIARCKNGTAYLPEYSNAIICAKVIDTQDYGTHTLFVGEVESAEVLSDSPSLTYSYYLENIRMKTVAPKKKGFICKICGYVYEGETLPTDYICPVCKHGAIDFEPIE